MTTSLQLAPGLDLPVDVVTEAMALVANRGAGKTYTSKKLVELMVTAGLPVAVLDPLGVWWGLKSSADGTKPGLPFIILGGKKGDAPLDEGSGKIIAQWLLENPVPVVLDLSDMRKTAQRRFVAAFLEELYEDNKTPLHVVVDECDLFAPQRPSKDFPPTLLGIMEDVVRRGRAKGLGITLISQRPAVIHKDVLSQVSILICLRLFGPQDRDAIAAWIDTHGTKQEQKVILDSLPGLATGEGWFYSPAFMGVMRQFKAYKAKTFDSSATPKLGERRIEPTAFAKVDLDALSARIAETIERAKANDPKELKATIARLTTALAAAEAATAEPIVEFIEIPTLDEELVVRAERVIEQLSEHGRQVLEASGILVENLGTARRLVEARHSAPQAARRPQTPVPAPAAPPRRPAAQSRREPTAGTADSWPADIGKAGRKILTVLAQHGDMTVTRLALQAGYSAQGGGFRNPMGALRTAGYITGGLRGENVSLTTEGQAVIPANLPALPTGAELVAHWVGQLPKAAALALQELADIWPDRISVDDLAARTGYEATGGGFRNALGRLRTLELIEGGLRGEPIGASDDLLGGQ